ncbi:transcriptional regulator with XRE-family HTH domain [Nocardia sp. GAS34]|uniref:helix-turn-helix domain-containing protein n=1 Tax=unclassified Nocardia TaxID=2637762 RepID=UPI003D1D1E83
MNSNVAQAREALGARLRELRRDAELNGQQLADRCGWSPSKVSRYEHGRQNVTEEDIRVWCAATGAEVQVQDLIATVRNIHAAYMEWRRILAAGHARRQQQGIARDQATRLTRWYETELIPGLLQTRDYATAVLYACREVIDGPDDLDAAVAARMLRQQVLSAGVHRFTFLLTEQCLYTRVGGPEVMAEQLHVLLEVHHNPRVSLRIIPRDVEFRYPSTNFVLFDRTAVQVETIAAELTITQPREIALYEKVFDLLATQAVTGDSARALITAALDQLGIA